MYYKNECYINTLTLPLPLLLSVTHGQCDARPTVTFPAGTHFAYPQRDAELTWVADYILR